MQKRRALKVATLFPALFLLVACDSDPTGADPAELVGTYAAIWSTTVVAGGFQVLDLQCPGDLNVTSQTNAALSGNFAIRAEGQNCQAADGTFEGAINSDGEIEIGIDGGSLEGLFDDVAECEPLDASPVLAGNYVNGVISAQTEISADCTTDFGALNFIAEIGVVATRS